MCGCNTNGCTDWRSAVPLAQFYASASGKQVYLDSVQISGIGAPGDTLLLAAGQRAEKVYLPMRATADKVAWRFAYGPAVADTVTIAYTPTAWFASEECGAMYKYTIRAVEHTSVLIDSVVVVNPEITNIETVRLKFFMADSLRIAGQ